MTIRTDVFACHVEVPFIWSSSCRIVLISCISTINCLAFYGSRDVGMFLKLLCSRSLMVRHISKSASGIYRWIHPKNRGTLKTTQSQNFNLKKGDMLWLFCFGIFVMLGDRTVYKTPYMAIWNTVEKNIPQRRQKSCYQNFRCFPKFTLIPSNLRLSSQTDVILVAWHYILMGN